MADKNVKIQVDIDANDSKVKAIDAELQRLKQQQLQLKIDANTTKLNETEKRIESLKIFLDTVNTGNTNIHIEDSEIQKAEKELEALESQKLNLQIAVADSELIKAKAEEEELNGSAQFEIEVNDTAVQTATQNLQSGLNDAKAGLSQVAEGFGTVLESAGRMEGTEAFLKMNMGADKAKQTLGDIRSVTDQLPGDDVVLQNLLSQAAIKQPGLVQKDFEQMGSSAADYMAAMNNFGKTATETQQDLMNYILAGNTAEVQLSPILQSHIDDLKAANTPRERALALEKALKEEHWAGIASQDTYNNKLQTFTDLIERGKINFGSLFLGASKGIMSVIGGLDNATGGLIGMGAAIATEFGPGLFQGAQGFLSMGASLTLLSAKFGGIMPMISHFAGKIPLIGGALSSLSLGPIAIAIAAIVALGVAIFEVGKAIGWWSDLSTMFEAIGAGAQQMWAAFMNNEGVIMIIEQVKDAFSNLSSFLGEIGAVIAEALGFEVGGNFDIVSAAINALGQVGNAVLPVISGAIHYFKEACAALAPVVMWVIQNVIIPHFQRIYIVAVTVWPYVSAIISGAIGVIRGVISGAMGVWTSLQSAWRTLQSVGASVFGAINGIVSGAGGVWNSFKSTVMGAIQPIIDRINDLKNAASGVGDLLHSVGLGGIETPTVNTSYGSGGYSTVTQGNTIIFNMYGDIRDEKTLDDTIEAINSRIQFEAFASGINDNGAGTV